MISTGDSSYSLACRPRITIKTIDGSDTLYTFDAFSASNPINITALDVEGAIGESGTFMVQINDNNNLIPKDNIHNVKAFIELGKTSSYTNGYFMIGYGDLFSVDRAVTNSQIYNLTGFGSAVWASQLMIHRREKYDKGESDAKIYNIVDNALTKRKWRPLKDQDHSIEDITGWSPDGISTKVNIPIYTVNKAYVYFSDFLTELCDISGAVWFIDFTGGTETFTLSYNSDLHTPVVIKSGDLQDRLNDPADTTSYIKRRFSVDDGATSDIGIATRLITTTVSDDTRIYEQKVNDGSTNTTFKAIGQQVVIDNDSRRISSIELLLSKKGDPSSPKDRLNGDIVLDDGNKPSNVDGNILDEFHIDLGQIESNAKFIKVDVDVAAKQLDVAQAKIWIRIFQRSNDVDTNGDPDGNGNPNHGDKHTIRWHHNNILNTTQAYYSATANEGDENKKSTLNWSNSTNKGPLYALRINSNIRRAIARTNSGAANRLRLRELFVPTDFLADPQSVSRYLSVLLSQASKPRRSIQEFLVTIPNNFIFKPYQWVSFNDGLSGISQDLQVQRARYSMGSQGDDIPLGTLHCNLTLGGSYNTLTANCSCL